MPTELHIRKRVFALLMLLVMLFVVLFLRIVYLTTTRSEELTLRGVKQWTREGTVYARRGSILDTNGETLVMSATAYIVSADPRKISDLAGNYLGRHGQFLSRLSRSRYWLKSLAASEYGLRGSVSGTSVGAPAGFMMNLPSTSLNFFLPRRFSRSPTPRSEVL